MSFMQLFKTEVQAVDEQSMCAAAEFYNIKAMGFQHLWKDSTGKGTVVAVIDSGCDVDHPDIKNNIIGGFNFVPGQPTNDFKDENGHGTHVAGIIAANGKIKGGAPDAKLLILKVFDKSGMCDSDRVARAVQYAADWVGPNGERVDIINMSLGGPEDNYALRTAIDNAVRKNIFVVCAAGNSGDGLEDTVELDYPAAYSNTLSVGAINQNFSACYFTNTNKMVEVAAPGENIVSLYPGGSYVMMSGTSMACPHVSAFAACMIEKFSKRVGRKPASFELRMIVRLMTVDIGKLGFDMYSGYGFVTAYPDVSIITNR